MMNWIDRQEIAEQRKYWDMIGISIDEQKNKIKCLTDLDRSVRDSNKRFNMHMSNVGNTTGLERAQNRAVKQTTGKVDTDHSRLYSALNDEGMCWADQILS